MDNEIDINCLSCTLPFPFQTLRYVRRAEWSFVSWPCFLSLFGLLHFQRTVCMLYEVYNQIHVSAKPDLQISSLICVYCTDDITL